MVISINGYSNSFHRSPSVNVGCGALSDIVSPRTILVYLKSMACKRCRDRKKCANTTQLSRK